MEYHPEIVGNKIRQEREKLKLTQDKLGKKLGVVGKQISNYEKGITTPPIDVLFRLCKIFKCELGYILGEEDYSQGTKIETIIHEKTGLSIESMNTIKIITSTNRSAIEWGCQSEKYRRIVNLLLSSSGFLALIGSLGDLDDHYTASRSVADHLHEKHDEQLLNEAMDCYTSTTDYLHDADNEKPKKELAEAIIEIDAAIDRQHDLSFLVKVARYDLLKTFEALIDEIYSDK